MAYTDPNNAERLQKILSQAGVTSRRKAEQLILEGRVMVNGKVITELGTKADPEHDHIKVDGRLLKEPAEHIYIALYKPDSVVSTVSDPQRRKTVMDLLPGLKTRVYPVGRLDYHSQGLILLTNDGEFANAITAAKSHVTKTYMVKVKGSLTPEEEEQFRNGVPLSGIRTAPAGLKMVRRGDNPWYEVRLIEGRNQQIRIMFKHFGHLVEKLKRVSIGEVELGILKPAEFRFLEPHEVKGLMRLAQGRGEAPQRPAEPARPVKKKLGAKRIPFTRATVKSAKSVKKSGSKASTPKTSASKTAAPRTAAAPRTTAPKRAPRPGKNAPKPGR